LECDRQLRSQINQTKIESSSKRRNNRLHPQSKKTVNPVPPPSHQILITQLRKRIKRLEADNRALSHQLESFYKRGSAQHVQNHVASLEAQNARLKAKNRWLKQKLLHLNRSSARLIVHHEVQAALDKIGLKLNLTLAKTMQSVSIETVLTAIAALEQAMTTGNIERPGGWLKRAIEQSWEPNRPLAQTTQISSAKAFSQWFNLARNQGLVVASMKAEDGQIYVFDPQGVRRLFTEMFAEHPLESLVNHSLDNEE
jgi:hypothetical protein